MWVFDASCLFDFLVSRGSVLAAVNMASTAFRYTIFNCVPYVAVPEYDDRSRPFWKRNTYSALKCEARMDSELNHVIDSSVVSPSFARFEREIRKYNEIVPDREWIKSQLAGENHLLEMIASGESLRDVLDALCTFVEKIAPECCCGVYLVDWSGPTFLVGAAPSLPQSYIEPIEGLAVGCDIAPCGIAALLKKQVISADLSIDPLWKSTPYCAHVSAHGLRSVWSTPILSRAENVLGTFAIYHRKPSLPSARLQELIAQVTHIASIAIERSQAEDHLKRNESLLAEGQRLSSTGTFWWRVATDDIQWSEESYRIHDVSLGTSLTFELLASRVHPEDLPLFMEHVERARHDTSDLDFEYRLRMSDGTAKYVHVVARSTRDRSEYIGAIQDVTSQRRSEEALSKVRSELAHVARVSSLGAMTASIAHEVNQPLSGIITNANTCLRMLDATPANVDGARETARRMLRDGNRAADVIARLRALFSRKEFTVEPLDLNDAAREVIALSSSELQRSRVVLQAELADDLPRVTGDRVQLQQVILNLLRNALDAMNDIHYRPRQLLVRTEREGADGVRLTVRDTGVGVDDVSLDKLFDVFYSTKSEGMGVGLAVSRSIIESHRGRIWAAANEDSGATFAFTIPSGSTQ
jgi:signal transduction histidine kinase